MVLLKCLARNIVYVVFYRSLRFECSCSCFLLTLMLILDFSDEEKTSKADTPLIC